MRRCATARIVAVLVTAVAGALAPAAAAQAADHQLFVSGFGIGRLTTYAVDGAAGGLVRERSYRGAGNTQEAAVVSPDGRFVAMTNRATQGSISIWSRDGGRLEEVDGSPFSTAGYNPVGLAFTPDGRHLYASNYDSRNVAAFDVADDGTLSLLRDGALTRTAGVNPIGVAVTPDGRRLYVTHVGTGTVAGFAIGDDGALTTLPGSPYPAGGVSPTGIGVTPDGRYLYTEDTVTATVTGHRIGSDGRLTRITQPPVRTGGRLPLYLELSRDGRALYVSNLVGRGGRGSIGAFAIGDDGRLSPLPGSPTGTHGLLAQPIAIAPDLGNLYVAHRGSGTIAQLRMGADGALSYAGRRRLDGFASPGYQAVAISPDRSPIAAFTTRSSGTTVQFDAGGSADPDGGTVVRYDWDFGDGTGLADAGPTPSHEYRVPGTYTVRLTVTDDEGCSTDPGFTGRTAACAAASAATSAREVPAT